MPSDERLNVRLPSALKAEVQEYASRTNTSLSQLVVQLLVRLLEHDKAKKDADQI